MLSQYGALFGRAYFGGKRVSTTLGEELNDDDDDKTKTHDVESTFLTVSLPLLSLS